MPTVQDLLTSKNGPIYTIPPSFSVLDATRKMNQHRIGALVVVDAGQVVGMFTERDVLRLVAALQDVCHITVRDVMSRDIFTASMCTDLEEIQELMRNRRVRHVPIVDESQMLCGIISIGDLNAWCVAHQARQLEGLNEYIYGRA